MKVRLFLALLVGVIMLSSAVATAQTSSQTNLLICGMSKADIQATFGEYDETNLADKLIDWVNAGKFDDTSAEAADIKRITDAKRDRGNAPYDISKPNMTSNKRMCLLALLTSMADFSDATKRTNLLTAVDSRYTIGAKTSNNWKTFDKVLSENNPVPGETPQAKAARINTKAKKVIEAFFAKTIRIRTVLLNETVPEYSGMTDADARQAVIDLLLSQINTTTIVDIQTVTIQIGVKPEDKSKEVLALLDKKIENIKKVDPKNPDCESLKAMFNIAWGGVATVSDPSDGTIDKNINTFTPGKFSTGAYVVSTVPAGDLMAVDQVAAEQKLAELKALYDKLKCKKISNINYGDLDGIPAIADGWFLNWRECNDVNIPVDNGLTMVETGKQKILEANYTEAQAGPWGLTEKDGSLTNNVIPGELINQLEIFVNASVVVRNAGKDNAQKRIDLNATCPEDNNKSGKNTTECAEQWEEQDKYSSKVSEAEKYIEDMNNELLTGFSTDAVKNICFGFNIKSANSPVAQALIKDISDLSQTLSAEKTIELYTVKQTNRTASLKINDIQDFCVFFNRIKKAEISGNEKDFAQKLVALFGIDDEKKEYITGAHGVDPQVVLVTQLADALANQNDEMIIHWISFLKGVNIFDLDYFAEREQREEDGIIVDNKINESSLKFTYSKYDVLMDLVIENSAAGSQSTSNNKTPKDNKNNTPVNDGNGTSVDPQDDQSNSVNIGGTIGDVKLNNNNSSGTTKTDPANNGSGKTVKKFDDRTDLDGDLKKKDEEKKAWDDLKALIESYLKGTDADFQKILDMVDGNEALKDNGKIKDSIIEKIIALLGITADADKEKVRSLFDSLPMEVTGTADAPEMDMTGFDAAIKDCSADLSKKFAKDSDGFKKLIRGRVLFIELAGKIGVEGRVPTPLTKEQTSTYKKLTTPGK